MENLEIVVVFLHRGRQVCGHMANHDGRSGEMHDSAQLGKRAELLEQASRKVFRTVVSWFVAGRIGHDLYTQMGELPLHRVG